MLIEKKRGIHPRIDLTADEYKNIKLNAEEIAVKKQKEIDESRKAIEGMIAEGPVKYDSPESIKAGAGQFGNAVGNMRVLHLLGDDYYFDSVKELAIHYASFPSWAIQWNSDLSTTMFLNSYAGYYDLVYDKLTPEERILIREAIMNKGIIPLLQDWVLPNTRIHALDSMGHNWWAVCIGSAVVGMCSVYDEYDDKVKEYLEMAMAALHEFCEYKGNPMLGKTATFDDGMFYEGGVYFNYGIGELANSVYIFNKCFESDLGHFPILEKVADVFLSLAYPRDTSSSEDKTEYYFANFGDSYTALGVAPLVTSLIKMGYGGDNLKRYFARARNFELSVLDYAYPGYTFNDGKSPRLLKSFCSENGGICTIRTSDDNNANMLSVRCGYTWNHAHADAGSFVLFHGGDCVIGDSGTTAYGRKEYANYYCQSEAHNVVHVNNEERPGWNVSRGSRLPGKIRNFVEEGKLCYFVADATGPMSKQCFRGYRNFIRLDDGLYVIVDDVTAYDESSYNWLLHYNGKMSIDKNRITLEGEKTKTYIDSFIPGGYSYEEREREGRKYLSLNQNLSRRVFNAFTVISFEDSVTTVTPIEANRQYGVEINQNGNNYKVYWNQEADSQRVHSNSINKLGDWVTDAYLLCDINNGEKLIMSLGSFLRKDSKSYFESFTKQVKIL